MYQMLQLRLEGAAACQLKSIKEPKKQGLYIKSYGNQSQGSKEDSCVFCLSKEEQRKRTEAWHHIMIWFYFKFPLHYVSTV